MFSLFLSTILAAAPIQKTKDEGAIAFILEGDKTELILLTPSGQEIKRVDINVRAGHAFNVKLSANHDYAFVTTNGIRELQIGHTFLLSFNGSLQPLDGKSKPEILFEEKHIYYWIMNRNATQIIASEYDQEKMAKMKPGDKATKSWIYDIKTKKRESIPLPSAYYPIDITADGSTVLTSITSQGKTSLAIAPTSTWKPVLLTEATKNPHRLSPDGNKVILSATRIENGKEKPQFFIYDVKTNERLPLDIPIVLTRSYDFAFSPDSKHLAIVCHASEQTPDGNIYTYRVYTSKIDGTDFKLLFKSQKGDYISSIDWR